MNCPPPGTVAYWSLHPHLLLQALPWRNGLSRVGALFAEPVERQLGHKSPIFKDSQQVALTLPAPIQGPSPTPKDPSLLIQTKSQLDVISDGKETLDLMWKHVVCAEELNHDLLHTTGAIPILISFPSLVFQ